MRRTSVRRACAVAVALLLALGVRAHAAETLVLGKPQPGEGALKPGLAVKYVPWEFNHVDEVVQIARSNRPKPGAPIPMLNYRVGNGKVLTSDYTDLVGAFIDGFVHLPKPGKYLFTIQHNDGVRFFLGGKKIYENPGVTADVFSPHLEITISEGGWYPLSMIYFEKRNTATLELYWQPPGEEDFKFVPAANLGHDPGKE
jgi:hypothetical protein